MNGTLRVRVPSKLQKPLMIVVGVGALGAFWFALDAFRGGDPLRGALGVAVVLALFGLNYVIRFRFGNVVEIDEQGITEHARRGDVRIAWHEPHQLEGYDMGQFAIRGGVRAATAGAMVRGTKSRGVTVATPDGRRIRIDTVLGMDAAALEAIARYSQAAHMR